MGYPPYPPQQPGQQPYGQYPPAQGGYPPQQPPPGYPPAQQGYPQQGGYPPAQQGYGQPMPFAGGPAGESYDFATLHGQADHTAGTLLEAGKYLARPESAEWGRSRDGTKSQWTVVFRTTTGLNKMPGASGQGAKLAVTISISPKKNDGSDNPVGLGIMFKQLYALGVPVGPPLDPSQHPFWELGMSEQQVAALIVQQAREVELTVIQSEYPEGSGQFNNKVRRIDPGPVGGQQAPPLQGAQPPAPGGYPPAGYGQAPQGMAPQPFQAPQPGYPPQGQMPPQQPFPGGPGAPGQAASGMGQVPPGYPPAGPGPVPGVPPYAQPAQPGQPGVSQFTPDGQAIQPGTVPFQQPAQPQPQPQQPGPDQGQQPGGAPPLPPWAQ